MERTKKSKGKRYWRWYDTGAPPPSLAKAKGSAHTRYSIFCWWALVSSCIMLPCFPSGSEEGLVHLHLLHQKTICRDRCPWRYFYLKANMKLDTPPRNFHTTYSNLSGKQQEKKTEDFSVIRWSIGSGVYKDFFIFGNKQTGKSGVCKVPEVGTTHLGTPRRRAVVSCAHQDCLPGCLLFS